MNWKEPLHKLEYEEAFDIAIFFMQTVIEKKPSDRDAYLALIYLLADTMIEPHSWELQTLPDQIKKDYYRSKESEYETLAKKYFALSYFKFMKDPEYLFIVGHAFIACPWIVGLGDNYPEITFKKAHELDPDNPIYLGDHYNNIYQQDPTNLELIKWAKLMHSTNSPLDAWQGKGRVWDYTAGMLRRLSRRILKMPPFDI